MATNIDARLQYEAGSTAYSMAALTPSSDTLSYSGAAAPWSNRSGYAPVVRPNGILSGGAITVSGTDNVVNIAAISCNLNGVVTAVAGGTLTASRGALTDTHRITSLTINSSGSLAAVAGGDGTAFSETRGADGGPPYIPVDSIEIGQVRFTSVTAAAVTAAEIFSVPGTHTEMAYAPLYEVNNVEGKVTMYAAVAKNHTGDLPKRIYASYATPQFADIAIAGDFVPPTETWSVSSTQYYGVTRGSSSKSLNAGSFTMILNDGISDPILQMEGEDLWFKFFQDRARTPYELCQGKFGISRTFVVANEPQAACVIAASAVGTRNAS